VMSRARPRPAPDGGANGHDTPLLDHERAGGNFKDRWNDDYAAVVDRRPVIARGGLPWHLQDPDTFRRVAVGEHGHAVLWVTDKREEIEPPECALLGTRPGTCGTP
jgi:hypothetical protein